MNRRDFRNFDSDADSVDRDSFFESPPFCKRDFRRLRKPWALVKEWSLAEYDKAVVYEEIKAIMEQSLDDAGPKVFVKPNPNSIAGFRQKQAILRLYSIASWNLTYYFQL
jgi:hypothetical protein